MFTIRKLRPFRLLASSRRAAPTRFPYQCKSRLGPLLDEPADTQKVGNIDLLMSRDSRALRTAVESHFAVALPETPQIPGNPIRLVGCDPGDQREGRTSDWHRCPVIITRLGRPEGGEESGPIQRGLEEVMDLLRRKGCRDIELEAHRHGIHILACSSVTGVVGEPAFTSHGRFCQNRVKCPQGTTC